MEVIDVLLSVSPTGILLVPDHSKHWDLLLKNKNEVIGDFLMDMLQQYNCGGQGYQEQ